MNYLAVLVSAIVSMVIGGLWFSPVLFGKLWMKLAGHSDKDVAGMKKKIAMGYIIGFITTLITVWVLAWTISATGMNALTVALMIWLGFFGASKLGMVLWDNKPFSLYLILVSYDLVMLLVSSWILMVWV